MKNKNMSSYMSFYIHHVGRFWKLLIDPGITQDACNYTEPSECMTQLAVSLSVAQWLERLTGHRRPWVRFSSGT